MTGARDISSIIDPWALKNALKAAGFSPRAASGLAYSSLISTVEDLRTLPWGSLKDETGLAWDLRCVPNLGPKGLAEVIAFREGRDPRGAKAPGPERVSIALEADELDALDAWIAKQPQSVTRPEAIRAFVAAGLAAGEE